MTMNPHIAKPPAARRFWVGDFDEMRGKAASLERLINLKRPPKGHPIKRVKSFIWHLLMRPLHEFNTAVSRLLEEILYVLDDHFSMNMIALEERLAQSEKREAALAELIGEQLALLHEVKALVGLKKIAIPETHPAGVSVPYIDTGLGKNRTAYIIGLFGTGRQYLNELTRNNIGERARYFRDTIGLHPGPTPMIYSGHATIRHISRMQASPVIMGCILEAVRLEFADLIFIHRHPLDSLLTNWIWWRNHLRDHRWIAGITEIYPNIDELCAVLERNFPEFQSFAQGDPAFFAAAPGQPFLSFPEFVEETELHLQSATLILRLEDFMADPLREFCKIAETMTVDLDSSRLSLDRPKSKAYGYLAVREKVPRFRDFIDGLDADTRRRIETIGYHVTA
jgi:hypothetical protein